MGHTFSDIVIHVIFSTKGRQPTIREAFRSRLYEYLSGIARKEFGRALKIGGTENHLHGLLLIRTDVSVAEAMRKWKSLSSGWVHKTFPDGRDLGWQSGYAAFSVSGPRKGKVIEYIDRQVDHHRTVTFEEEFLAFLDRYEIDYDPRYVWDDDRVREG